MRATTPTHIVKAIVADYRNGDLVHEIAARYDVSHYTVCKYAARAGLRRPKGTSPRPTVPCQHCGTLCRSVRRECRNCVFTHPDSKSDEPDELTGGRWVFDPFRRIQVWAPWADERSAA